MVDPQRYSVVKCAVSWLYQPWDVRTNWADEIYISYFHLLQGSGCLKEDAEKIAVVGTGGPLGHFCAVLTDVNRTDNFHACELTWPGLLLQKFSFAVLPLSCVHGNEAWSSANITELYTTWRFSVPMFDGVVTSGLVGIRSPQGRTRLFFVCLCVV